MKRKKNIRRELVLGLVFLISLLGVFMVGNSPASGTIGLASVTTPPLTTTTTFSPTSTTSLSTTETTLSTSTSTTSTTISTTSTSLSSSFSYTTTVSSTSTSTQTSTVYTSTNVVTTTTYSPTPSTTFATATTTTTVLPSIFGQRCALALATSGTPLEPYANFLRGFRNNQIENTTAGRVFMQTFNGWYYGWVPSVSYAAAGNPWFLDMLRVGVYPLIGILYASYFTYAALSPWSTEAGAIAAGVVAASLIGLVYVAPGAYVSLRLIRRRMRFFTPKKAYLFPTAGWVGASALTIGVAYVSGSAWLMGLATASLTLSMLSVASVLGAVALTSIQLPLADLRGMIFVVRRTMQLVR